MRKIHGTVCFFPTSQRIFKRYLKNKVAQEEKQLMEYKKKILENCVFSRIFVANPVKNNTVDNATNRVQ